MSGPTSLGSRCWPQPILVFRRNLTDLDSYLFCPHFQRRNKLLQSSLIRNMHPLPPSEPFWNFAGIQFDGDQKDRAFRLFLGEADCVRYLALNIPFFADRCPRKAQDYRVTTLDVWTARRLSRAPS